MSLKERINLVKQQFGISETDTLSIEKALGKKVVDYESVEALVAALMGYYNEELKKKANSSHTHDYAPKSHTHDDRYFTESEINEKFKNFCPFKVGDIYLTTNSTNPSSIFLGTTWQKIEGRFLLGTSGSGASKATGGSNQKTIAQANLPNIKLKVDSFTPSISQAQLTLRGRLNGASLKGYGLIGAGGGAIQVENGQCTDLGKATTVGAISSSPISPNTSALGSGQALDITPAYYTVHMWLRLT